MATPRLLVVFLLLAAVTILVLQNTSPALPLVFLGVRTSALPLAVWLVGAIALGSLTSVLLATLVSAGTPDSGRSSRRPSRFGRRIDAPNTSNPPPSSDRARGGSAKSRPTDPAAGGEWGEWTTFRSPSQWDDWNQADQASGGADSQNKGPRWGRKRAAEQAQKVDESWQELSDGWDELENVRYKPRGVSPVADALDDLDQGWDEYPDESGNRSPASRQDFEANQSPKRVYRDGSIYSYSYRDPDSTVQGRTDSVYGPEDSEDYDDDYEENEDFENEDGSDSEALRDPRLGPDGVVDADYRVIVPPLRSLQRTNSDDEDDDNWVDGPPNP
ncbi:MAG TPA: hypothetical protein V6D07_17075 [Trichocoleus sp.]